MSAHDLTVPPKENVIEQYMAARRDVDSRRQPHKLDVEMITSEIETVIAFCKSMDSSLSVEERTEKVLEQFSELVEKGFKTLVIAASKCVRPEDYRLFESMFKLMISKIVGVQSGTITMANATDSVSEVLDSKFVKPTVEKKNE